MRLFAVLWLILVACLFSSCGFQAVVRPDSLVVVKDIDIPKSGAKIAQFATHTFLDYRADVGSPWRRVEVTSPRSGVVDREIRSAVAYSGWRWGERVRILSQSDGKGNPHFVRDIRDFVAVHDDSVYRSYPGPNSNTFMEQLVREVDGVSALLDHNAIGKEVGFYMGRTAGGTGVKIQTPIAGLALGLKEGVEVSAIGLSGGISMWPLSVRIPFLPKLPTWE